MGFVFDFLVDCMDKIVIIATFVLLIWNIYIKFKENQGIKILIIKDGIQKSLPTEIPRKQFSRSEVLGVLGVFDRQSNFDIAYTSTPEFFEQIARIQRGKAGALKIPLQDNDRFDCVL